LKITFLGTGTSQGVPVISCPCNVCQSNDSRDKRLRTSLMIEDNGINLVIDSGPDFRQQMLRENVKTLDGILLTHAHKDHIAGLDDIRAFNYTMQRPMDVYADLLTQKALKREFSYVFAKERYPGIPEMNLLLIENQVIKVKHLEILPVKVIHCKLSIYGFRIGGLTYITDANFIAEEEKEKILGSKIFIINALRKKKHISHFSLDEALQLIDEVRPENAYLTHLSHQMGLHEEIEKELPKNVHLAYDQLVLEL
jgi:phosphoribosyl 1,2-cyclic phosphate phosphodiesterase